MKDADDFTLVRFLLAAIFDRLNPDHKFKATLRYHGEPCDIFTIAENRTVKQKDTHWTITHDQSVILTQDSLYQTFPIKEYILSIPSSNIIQCVEIVSPILNLGDLKYQGSFDDILQNVLPANDHFSYWNNEKTSCHVHFSLSDDLLRTGNNLFKIAMAWWCFEPFFMLLVGHWRRNNEYCIPLRRKTTPDHFKQLRSLLQSLNKKESDPFRIYREESFIVTMLLFQGLEPKDRYTTLNMFNLLPGGIGTIEVRLKQGSSSSEENKQFILLMMFFILSAVRNPLVNKNLVDLCGSWFHYKDNTWQLFDIEETLWKNSDGLKLSREKMQKNEDILHGFITKNLTENEKKQFANTWTYWKNMFQGLHKFI